MYQETHANASTDANGIIILNIGNGTTTDVFTGIVWGNDEHWLNVQIDIGAGLVDISTTQFMAIPYALNVPKKQHMIGIPATAFSPNNNDCTFVNSVINGGVEITSTNGAVVTNVLNAPIQLPHGAQIDSMTMY